MAETGLAAAQGLGRPSTPLRIDGSRRAMIGVEIAVESLRVAAVSLTGEVIWSIDAQSHRMLYLNRAIEGIYGRPVQALFDSPQLWLDVVVPEDLALAQAMKIQAREHGRAQAEYRIVRPDGEVRWTVEMLDQPKCRAISFIVGECPNCDVACSTKARTLV